MSLEDLLGIGETSDSAEDTAELSATQQDTAVENTGGGANIAGVSGRYRHISGALDTADGNSFLDIPFDDGSVVNGLFNVALASFLTIPGVQVGTFSFGPGGTDSPFGPIFGTGFVNAAEDFGFAEFEESNFPGDLVVAWAGIPTQLGAFPSPAGRFRSELGRAVHPHRRQHRRWRKRGRGGDSVERLDRRQLRHGGGVYSG